MKRYYITFGSNQKFSWMGGKDPLKTVLVISAKSEVEARKIAFNELGGKFSTVYNYLIDGIENIISLNVIKQERFDTLINKAKQEKSSTQEEIRKLSAKIIELKRHSNHITKQLYKKAIEELGFNIGCKVLNKRYNENGFLRDVDFNGYLDIVKIKKDGTPSKISTGWCMSVSALNSLEVISLWTESM